METPGHQIFNMFYSCLWKSCLPTQWLLHILGEDKWLRLYHDESLTLLILGYVYRIDSYLYTFVSNIVRVFFKVLYILVFVHVCVWVCVHTCTRACTSAYTHVCGTFIYACGSQKRHVWCSFLLFSIHSFAIGACPEPGAYILPIRLKASKPQPFLSFCLLLFLELAYRHVLDVWQVTWVLDSEVLSCSQLRTVTMGQWSCTM